MKVEKGRMVGMDNRPCLIVAYSDSAFAARWGRYFRRHGWAVHLTPRAAELEELAERLEPAAIVIDCELPGAASPRVTAELARRHGGAKLVLVDTRSRNREVGSDAAYFSRQAAPETVFEHLQSRRLVSA
jgi:ActR/RegA family two-component response regulator